MKTFIIKDVSSKTGFSVLTELDDGTEKISPITTIIEDGRTLKLPANPSNRQYFSKSKASVSDKVELLPRDQIRTTSGVPGNSGSSKSTKISFDEEDLKVLSEDEVSTIKSLYEKVEKSRQRRALEEGIKKYQEALEKLMKEIGIE